MKILLLPKYSRRGASSRLRALQYIPYFEQAGLEVTVKSLLNDEYLDRLYSGGRNSIFQYLKYYINRTIQLFFIFKYDVVWVEKELYPYFPGWAERALAFLKKPMIVDYDDAIFHNYDLSKFSTVRRFLGNKIDSVMRASTCVTAGNYYLAERAISAGADSVVIVPTVVDYFRYTVRSTKQTNALPVIGWMGSPSTQKYVVGVRDALVEACKKHGAQVILVGATPSIINDLPGVNVKVIEWSEDSEAELIRSMDIGIMPLDDGPWERGKCGYKLIQYMACAVPVVASAVGVNNEIVNHSNCGILVSTADEWRAALDKLLSSIDLRNTMGTAGREAVENKFSLQIQAPILIQLIKSLV